MVAAGEDPVLMIEDNEGSCPEADPTDREVESDDDEGGGVPDVFVVGVGVVGVVTDDAGVGCR